jgi:hypothetical protein
MSIVGIHMEAMASLTASEILRERSDSKDAKKIAKTIIDDARLPNPQPTVPGVRSPKP